MKKTILSLAISCTLLSACAYKPIINTTFVGNIVYWTLSPTMDTKKESLTRKCLLGRGHNVIN